MKKLFSSKNCDRTKSCLWVSGLSPRLTGSFGWKHINQKSLFAPIGWTWAHISTLVTSYSRDLNMWAKFDFLTYKPSHVRQPPHKRIHAAANIRSPEWKEKKNAFRFHFFFYSNPHFIAASSDDNEKQAQSSDHPVKKGFIAIRRSKTLMTRLFLYRLYSVCK